MILFLYLNTCFAFKILQLNFTIMSQCPGLGAEIEILLSGLQKLGLQENKDFTIECVNSIQEIQTRILTEQAVGFGGIRSSKSLIQSGFNLTFPTYYSGLNILINEVETNDYFQLFKICNLAVWVFFWCCPLVVGMLSWGLAIILDSKNFTLSSFLGFSWGGYCSLIFSPSQNIHKPGKLTEISLSIFIRLMFFILAALYASSDYKRNITHIEKFGDIAGQLVLVEPQYEDLCGHYAIYYYSFESDFYNDFDYAVELLKQNVYWGIIADNSFLVDKMKTHKGVSLHIYPFYTFNYVGIYGPNFDTKSARLINQALAQAQQTDIQLTTNLKYGLNIFPKVETGDNLSLENVAWLFYGLIFSCFIGFVLSLIPREEFYIEFWNRFFRKRSRFFDEVEPTNRTEIVENKKYMETEKIESGWAAEMPEEFIKLIKISTLNIIEYEISSLGSIQALIDMIKELNKEKLNLIKKIEANLK